MLLPLTDPACFGPLIEPIVPPQIVKCRETPEYFSAFRTVRPSALNGSDGNAAELDDGMPGTSTRSRRRCPCTSVACTQPLYVARKS